MPRHLLRLEFDGAPHCGWQLQGHELPEPTVEAQGKSSIQNELRRALATLLRVPDTSLRVVGCGRTDSGVHAREYFAHYDAPETFDLDRLERLRHGLNATLPESISVTAAYVVPDAFSAIEDVSSKIYEYRLLLRRARPTLDRGRCLWIGARPGEFRFDALDDALKRIEGEHDFQAFMAAGSDAKTTVRLVHDATYVREPLGRDATAGEWVWLRFHGRGFLKHMVRNLVGALVETGQGRREPVSFDRLLGRDGRPAPTRTEAGLCAPAEGLTLVQVNYRGGLDGFERVP